MKLKQLWLVSGLCSGLLLSFCACADFDVIQAVDADTYGNGQTGSFNRAIVGGSTMTAKEQQEIAAMLPAPEEGRFYGRARTNFSSLTLGELKNKSTGANAAGALGKKRSVTNQTGLEIAIGYMSSANFRTEVEYLINKNLNYLANPVLTGGGIAAAQLNTVIKNNTILLNGYYDFSVIERFRPYLTGGVGFAANSVQSSLTPVPAGGGSNTLRSLHLAWALGGGMRIGIFSHWYMDMSYRYVQLGSKLKIQAGPSVDLSGNYSANIFSIGAIYLF
jgi:opacity protein-like surface antigen